MPIKVGATGVKLPFAKAYVGEDLVYSGYNTFITTETGKAITTEAGDKLEFESVPYTMLEYLMATSMQYIDTGVYATNNTKVEITISGLQPIKHFGCVIGARTSAGASDEYCFFRTDGALYRSDFAGNRVTFTSGTDLTNKATIVKDGNTTTIGSQTITNTSATFTSTYPLWLFACNNGGVIANETSCKLYSCKIWDNGILLRDYIPVIDEENVVCLYDKVSETYFYNQGAGEFVASETSEYKTINYLESTGNQYIDTGVTQTNTEVAQGLGYNTFGLTYSNIAYGNSMCGARVSSTNSNFQYANGAFNEFIGAGTSQLSLTRNTNRDLLYLFYGKTSYHIYCGNYYQTSTISVSISTPLNIHLFGLNNNGTNAGGTWKIIWFNIVGYNSTKLRSFVPVIRKSDGKPCMYDAVNGQFYANAGTDEFLFG